MLPQERLKREARRLIRRFRVETALLQPRLMILFGSYARGDFTEDSDIDLCVVAEKLPRELFARRGMVSLYTVHRIRAIGFQPEEFLSLVRVMNLFVYDILEEGRVMFDDGFSTTVYETFRRCKKEYGARKRGHTWKWREAPQILRESKPQI